MNWACALSAKGPPSRDKEDSRSDSARRVRRCTPSERATSTDPQLLSTITWSRVGSVESPRCPHRPHALAPSRVSPVRITRCPASPAPLLPLASLLPYVPRRSTRCIPHERRSPTARRCRRCQASRRMPTDLTHHTGPNFAATQRPTHQPTHSLLRLKKENHREELQEPHRAGRHGLPRPQRRQRPRLHLHAE